MKTCLLLSGGMDSIALAYWKRPSLAITIDYGQLAAQAEIDASKAITKRLGIEHILIKVDTSQLGSGDMAGKPAAVLAPESDWWPYRNQLLVTLGAMKAISYGVTQLWLASVRSDNQHADGRPEFYRLMSNLLSMQEGGMEVLAPAISYSTSELIRISGLPKELLAYAHSCHKSIVGCGACRGCNKYIDVYEELGYDLDKSGEPQTQATA